MPDTKEKYPEHEKLRNRKKELQNVQDFCSFLERKGLLNRLDYYKDEYDDERLARRPVNIPNIIAEYFDIDPDKFEKEKLQMLEEIRNAQEK